MLPNSPDGRQLQSSSSAQRAAKTCMLCFEPGGKRRACCRAAYCDHCYVKNNKCPNCKALTKQEKLTGATYQLKVFSEQEECRICLDPGLLRRCCGNYYCDTCYYAAPLCRSCGTPVTNLQEEKHSLFADRAYCVTVCLGWTVTLFVAVVTLSFIAVVIAADAATPVGINDYSCYGFFRSCDVSQCIEVEQGVADGTQPIPPISSWTKCSLSSQYKLEAKSCLFDQSLYHQSERTLGFDICRDEFNEGVYVLEDTFEDWAVVTSPASSAMVSAKWANVTNGQTDAECGVGRVFGDRRSLRFGGDYLRFAETQDVDVRGGGQLEAELFLPPIGYDAFNPLCKTGYIGTVLVDYSINGGRNWTELAAYEPALYRADAFFPVTLPLPTEALTAATRFRFRQPVFEAARDNWALDNVRILRKLPDGWASTSSTRASVSTGRSALQHAQCCADTDWCAKRLSAAERQRCADEYDWYDGEKYLFRLAEVFLCMAVLMNVVRFLYVTAFDRLVRGRLPFHDDLVDLCKLSSVRALWRRIPLRMRPRPPRRLEEIEQIHRAARLEERLRADFEDAEGEGAMLVQREQAEEQRRAMAKKVRKQQRRLQARMKKKNYRSSTVAVEHDAAAEAAEAAEAELFAQVLPFADAAEAATATAASSALNSTPAQARALDTGATAAAHVQQLDEAERLRRQNLALLRVPFEHDVDTRWLHGLAAGLVGIFTLFFFLELSRMSDYQIYEPMQPFGVFSTSFYLNSYLSLFLAAYCDVKEIWATLRIHAPLFPAWRPPLTLDLSDDRRALFVGDYALPLSQVREVAAFPPQFARLLAAGLALGAFPWALMSLLLRETELTYETMRFASPLLGCIVITRAVLGPGLFIKAAFAFQHLFATSYDVREMIGNAVQQRATWHTALNVGLAFACLGAFFTAIAAVEWVPLVAPMGMVGGAVYGAFTGTAHHLAIKPWLCLTTLRGGVWMQVRKKQACPCVYWGRYCTAIHEYEEILVLFTTNDIKMTSLIHNGISAVNTFVAV